MVAMAKQRLAFWSLCFWMMGCPRMSIQLFLCGAFKLNSIRKLNKITLLYLAPWNYTALGCRGGVATWPANVQDRQQNWV